MMDRFQRPGISQPIELIFFLMVLWAASGTESAPGCHLNMQTYPIQYKYYQDGDILIGALFTVNNGVKESFYKGTTIHKFILCLYPLPALYRNVLTFIFAIEEINKNPDILPNITLGYHAYDTCGFVKKALQNLLQILSGSEREAPNYSCLQGDKVAGIIGDTRSVTTLPIAQLLGVYGYPQISYGATDTLLSNKVLYPNFFRTVRDDHFQHMAILKLLKHFKWNWVGIIASVGSHAERELQQLSTVFTNHGICIEFVIQISDSVQQSQDQLAVLEKSSTQIVIVCGACSMGCMTFLNDFASLFQNITLIIPASWTFIFNSLVTAFNGSLGFATPAYNMVDLKHFINNAQPHNRPNDPLLNGIWLFLNCNSSDQRKDLLFQRTNNASLRNCTGKENITDITVYESDPSTYLVYTAVYAMAYALHNMRLHWNLIYPKKFAYKNQLSSFVKKINFIDHIGNEIFFNEKGEVPGRYHLIQWKKKSHGTNLRTVKHVVGTLDTFLSMDQQFTISPQDITWKNGKIPNARCTDFCPPGYRKAPGRGYHTCCYKCVPCSDGEISEVIDSDSCQKCPDYEWPDERKIKCIPKTFDFLSYEEDMIAQLFTFMSVFFSCITCSILGIFIYFRETPIVKSNNRNLSFLLLVCIMLSFLCIFLFIGCPVDIACMLRETSFGIIFSIAVSSLLAKTIMVCIAFKAIKPGSHWRKWLGMKVSNSIVLICSSVQVLISAIWLAISPPFREFDMDTYPGVIIIQCNEGSILASCTVLGYMGILASGSFVLAFMVRTLPDSFNEAKYITFSLLVFCSVWIAMIPAYLSTTGRDVVSVEVFAILASSTGLLSCLFFPRCYSLLRKPEMNTKRCLLEKTCS